VAELKDGVIKNYVIAPEDFGLQRSGLEALKVGTAQESLDMILSVFANEAGPARDIIQLNAGAAIYVAGLTDSLEEGVARAGEVIASGEARARLDALVNLSQSI
jgi:anthranilate phosphoribosyltransferase